MPVPLRLHSAIPAVLVALALPAQASAHGRGATIALDYRLALDQSVGALPGVHVRVLDGGRAWIMTNFCGSAYPTDSAGDCNPAACSDDVVLTRPNLASAAASACHLVTKPSTS